MWTDESNWFWNEVAGLRDRWNVLEHPFYERWTSGRLTREELRRYADEYRHAVVAIAQASTRAAELVDDSGLLKWGLEEHADEERDHIHLWDAFAEATLSGSRRPDPDSPYEETVRCARSWAGEESRSLAGHLVTLYAIESTQPLISDTKLRGLVDHYGFDDGPATAYFRLHARVDYRHAALAREGLHEVAATDDPFMLLGQVEATHRTYWGLLDRLESRASQRATAGSA
jgi:pyrroloquinoline-quinone synthase